MANIWAQMSYTPPRGPCAQRLSMLTTCPCHRFMIHPLKAATSFECDGCGHHASFHRMANEGEEVVVRGWREEMKRVEEGRDGRSMQGVVGLQNGVDGIQNGVFEDGMREKKRRRMIEGPPPGAWGAAEDEEDEDGVEEVVGPVEVDENVMREFKKKIRAAEDVADHIRRRRLEEEKELERERAREAETLGRGRKRKGR